MNRQFLVLFALTTTFAVLALTVGQAVLSGGGLLPAIASALFAVSAALGLGTLVRIAYLDGKASRRGRQVRRRP